MSALEIIGRLRTKGIKISADDGKLRLQAAKGALSDELREEITRNKVEILALLSNVSHDDSAPPLKAIPRTNKLKLSFAQQRLWFLDEMEPGSPVYNMTFSVQLSESPNLSDLDKAANQLLERHEALRTCFTPKDGSAVQTIKSADTLAPVKVEVIAPTESTDITLKKLSQQSFDLSEAPLFKLHLVDNSSGQALLVLVIHHTIADLWSVNIFFRELAAYYAANISGAAVVNSPLPLQYADYAEWQHQTLSGERLDREVEFWKQQLVGAPPILDLPTDYQRPPEPSYNGKWISRPIDDDLVRALLALSHKESTTAFMVYLAAFNILLQRYSPENDIVIGTPVSGRTQTELEGLIGFFLNTLAIRTDVDPGQSFKSLLKIVRNQILSAHAHQELPFEKLVEELQPVRDMSHSPVFQVMFIWQEAVSEILKFGDIVGQQPEIVGHDTAKFDLSLAVAETARGTEVGIEFSTDLFNGQTIERMLDHFVALLEQIAAHPARPVGELPLMREAEQKTLLQDFNATNQPVESITVNGLVETRAREHPDAIAVEFGDQSVSYAELNSRANRLAHHLVENGIGSGDLVAICAERALEVPIAVLAVLKSGAAYVPVDPNYPAERVAAMLEDSQAPVILSQSALIENLPTHTATVVDLDSFDWSGGNDTDPELTTLDDIAYVIYTSGSTGKPKGVALSHAGLSNLLQWQQKQPGLDQPARTLQFASLSFDVSFQELFTTWVGGGTLILVTDELRRDLA
ncbi:MAG: condensation domain-containing protein, partial [Gammaproteobacteria bacterium]